MARDTLRYQYTGDEDTSRMPGNKVDDEDIVERLGTTVHSLPSPEYSAGRPPNKVSNCDLSLRVLIDLK
jgi:hypothetical protein